jgi:hypothetical protein
VLAQREGGIGGAFDHVLIELQLLADVLPALISSACRRSVWAIARAADSTFSRFSSGAKSTPSSSAKTTSSFVTEKPPDSVRLCFERDQVANACFIASTLIVDHEHISGSRGRHRFQEDVHAPVVSDGEHPASQTSFCS